MDLKLGQEYLELAQETRKKEWEMGHFFQHLVLARTMNDLNLLHRISRRGVASTLPPAREILEATPISIRFFYTKW